MKGREGRKGEKKREGRKNIKVNVKNGRRR